MARKKSNEVLKYADHDDRCYGIAGMVVSIFMFDGERFIDHVDASACDMDVVSFTPEFNSIFSPKTSVKAVWHAEAQRYRLLLAMVMGNVISRAVSHSRPAIDPVTLQSIIDMLGMESEDVLGLSGEENRELCLETYDQLRRAFSHPTVISLVENLAMRLREGENEMSRDILFEMLSPLLR